MRLIEITYSHRNDFSGIIECEHCLSTEKLTSGYDDDYYHNSVIPAKKCKSCKKNRAGEILETTQA